MSGRKIGLKMIGVLFCELRGEVLPTTDPLKPQINDNETAKEHDANLQRVCYCHRS